MLACPCSASLDRPLQVRRRPQPKMVKLGGPYLTAKGAGLAGWPAAPRAAPFALIRCR
jgi:hypothetical protein